MPNEDTREARLAKFKEKHDEGLRRSGITQQQLDRADRKAKELGIPHDAPASMRPGPLADDD